MRHNPNRVAGLLALGMLLCLLCAGVCRADGASAKLIEGLVAYDRGDFKGAMDRLLPLAKDGSPEAQYRVGEMYRAGKGTMEDVPKAMQWFRQAAEKGNTEAMWSLGFIYKAYDGYRNYTNAAKWWHKATINGHRDAPHDLGMLYLEGVGVTKDREEAKRLFRLAGERGRSAAMLELSYFFEVDADNDPTALADDITWYLRQAESENRAAQAELGGMYKYGRVLSHDLDLAGKWITRAAKNGDFYAKKELNYLVTMTKGVPQEYAAAVRWYLNGAKGGEVRCMDILADMYTRGFGVPGNATLAAKWVQASELCDYEDEELGPAQKDRAQLECREFIGTIPSGYPNMLRAN